MGRISGFDQSKEESKKLSFFKIFQSADLSSESMRAFPYKFMRKVSEEDFSYKMVIRAQWGSSWEVDISKNQIYYYMERRGWDQFVNDNALGENEFITFTLKEKMCFDVNIYEQNGKEMLIPRKLQKMGQPKKESSFKDVKKEEETGESPGDVSEKKIKRKKMVNSVEIGESSGKKKKKSKSKKKEVPEFTITIKKSYLKFLAIPKQFIRHIPNDSKICTIHHSNGNYSWKVLCLVRKNRAIFSSGWSKMAREYPLLIDDICTFKLISPTEFLLVISKKAREEITL